MCHLRCNRLPILAKSGGSPVVKSGDCPGEVDGKKKDVNVMCVCLIIIFHALKSLDFSQEVINPWAKALGLPK